MTACSYLFLRLLWYKWQCFRTTVVPCWRRELQHQSSPKHELHAKHCVGTIIKLDVAALKILQSPNIRSVLEVLTQLGPLPYGVACLYSGKMWKLSILLRVTRQNLHLWLGRQQQVSAQVFEYIWPNDNDICKVNLLGFMLNIRSGCPGGCVNTSLAAMDFKETILFWGMCMGAHFPLSGHYGNFGFQLHFPRLPCHLEPHLNLWKRFLGVCSIYMFKHLNVFLLLPHFESVFP